MKILTTFILFLCCGFSVVLQADNKTFSENAVIQTTFSYSLISNIGSEYKIKLYEPFLKHYMFYLGGTIEHDRDHFGRITRTNCFTNIGIEF